MISYNYETNFKLTNTQFLSNWLTAVIEEEHYKLGEINYIFCTDSYLHKINLQYLNHDTYTDIISFDYSDGKILSGDIYISVERVEENARIYDSDFNSELLRVMAHGILHYCGYKDKSSKEKGEMRCKEDYYIQMHHSLKA